MARRELKNLEDKIGRITARNWMTNYVESRIIGSSTDAALEERSEKLYRRMTRTERDSEGYNGTTKWDFGSAMETLDALMEKQFKRNGRPSLENNGAHDFARTLVDRVTRGKPMKVQRELSTTDRLLGGLRGMYGRAMSSLKSIGGAGG